MARCTNDDCGAFTGFEEDVGKVWFKVDEMGYNSTSKQWATYYLFKNGNTWSTIIPACLAPGEYLVRSEIIALSECKTVGQCQFYPECTQIKVEGDGTVVPGEDGYELVAFPGAYKTTDRRILWDTNTANKSEYVIPGPAVFSCP